MAFFPAIYKLAPTVVYYPYMNGKEVQAMKGAFHKLAAGVLAVVLFCITLAVPAGAAFSDVKPGDWFQEDVAEMAAAG